MKYGKLTLNTYGRGFADDDFVYGLRFPFWARFCPDMARRLCLEVGFELRMNSKLQIIAYNRPSKNRIEVRIVKSDIYRRWVLYCGTNIRTVHEKFLWALNLEPEEGAYFWIEFKQPKG